MSTETIYRCDRDPHHASTQSHWLHQVRIIVDDHVALEADWCSQCVAKVLRQPNAADRRAEELAQRERPVIEVE